MTTVCARCGMDFRWKCNCDGNEPAAEMSKDEWRAGLLEQAVEQSKQLARIAFALEKLAGIAFQTAEKPRPGFCYSREVEESLLKPWPER